MRICLRSNAVLIAFFFLLISTVSGAQVGVSVNFSIHTSPPALPVYAQPPCPADGYLWTPGYWGFAAGVYTWHPGYWGPDVGFYGGVHYGFGYTGVGFIGGGWHGGIFRYNTAIVNVNRTVVRNTYVDRTVMHNTTVLNRASFNGTGGITARPTPFESAVTDEHHFQPTASQVSHEQMASRDFNQRSSVNHGRPLTTSTNSINGRSENEQHRIAEGFRSGRMTPPEADRAENHEQNINRYAAADRATNGGKLTPGERQNIRQRQNKLAEQIHDDKHN